ncbi:MAG TPA: cytochrome P450 [Actinomycetota bacterium]|nr:cytochrome P450 [Actinomycetota bacterium]
MTAFGEAVATEGSGTVDVTTPGAVETALFNPYDQAIRADPWGLCRALRDHDPVYASPFGAYIVTDYEHGLSVLRSPDFSVDPRKATALPFAPPDALSFAERGLDHTMLFVDPPDHTRLRSLVSKAFSPRAIAALRVRIEALVTELLDGFDGDEVDLMASFYYPLPVTVIAEMLGIPAADREVFRGWAKALAPVLDPLIPPDNMQEMATAGIALVEYVDALIAERRRDPGTDLISELIRAEDEGDRLSGDEVRSTVILLLIAGHETTMNSLGNGTYALAQRPDELRRLYEDPALLKPAIEEIFRHDGPGLITARIALREVEVADKKVTPGQIVVVVIGAANRDPKQFDDPDRFDVGRDPNKHLAFSAGPHFCLGAVLARMEMQIALGALLRRHRSIELMEQPRWRRTVTFRGLESLKVRLGQ